MKTEIKDRIKEYFPYCTVVAAIIVPFFLNSGYLFFIDFSFGPNINIDWTSGWLMINLVFKFLASFLATSFLEKLFIGFILLLVLLGGKKISSFFIKDKMAIFTVSLFALFNPFVYDRIMYGQIGIVLSFGLLLLATGYILRYLENREAKYLVYFGICAGFALQFSTHFIFFFGIIFLLFLILYFNKWKLNGWKYFFKYIVLAGLLCLLLNSNWIIGDFLKKTNTLNFIDSGITKQDLLAFKTSGSSNSQVLNNVAMMSGFWGKDQYRYADLTQIKNNWGRSFLFLLPIIIYGFYSGIRKKENRLFSTGLFILFLVGVVLASGISVSYFQNFTHYLFEHIPFYKGFREPQKWVAVIALVYLIFLSIGIKEFLKNKTFLIHKYAFLIFLGTIIIMQAPFLLLGLGGQVKPVFYPEDWYQVNNEIECAKEERAVFLPWHLYMSFNWTGRVISNPAKQFFTCPIISSTAIEWGGIYDNSRNEVSLKINQWIKEQGSNDLFKNNELNIKYVIIAKELDWENYFWINQIPDLKLKGETKTLKIYEIQNNE